uniref:Uncharacterized protein n=1 Tax=viral metagenome TaxID=1070528 RepID=A0A6C0KS89_9ZZZZ
MSLNKSFNKSLKKDDIFKISLPGSDLVFTRYLYVKDEIRISFLISILNKRDDAIFWAYELYFSGFKCELFELLWQIYYDFFATLNPSFETYFIKKYKDWLKEEDDKIVKMIVQDLLFRPCNSDVFFLKNICQSFEVEMNYLDEKISDLISFKKNMEKWFENNDYRSISNWILNENSNQINNFEIYNICIEIFNNNGIKLVKKRLLDEFNNASNINLVNGNIVLLAKIMTLFSKKFNLKKGKNLYFTVSLEEIEQYETINISDELINCHILENACLVGIDDLKQLSLFKLNRFKYDLNECYNYKWLYHASFSPIWSYRIRKYKAYPDYFKQKIIFKENPDDIEMQEFYKLYGLDPDEQKQIVKEKSIMAIENKYDWKWFYKTYKKNGLFDVLEEELVEFDEDKIKY